jgi:phosphohistidine phosphatase SixA
MRVYIVRHGQSTNNAGQTLLDDPPLTPLGRKQMKRVAKWLLSEPGRMHWLFTSPFLRAQQSAAIVAQAIELEPETWDDLREYESDLESLEQMWERAQRVAEEVLRRFGAREENNIVLVTHGTFGSRLVCAFTHTSPHTRFTHFNGGISVLEWDEDGVLRVRHTNYVGHLSKDMMT